MRKPSCCPLLQKSPSSQRTDGNYGTTDGIRTKGGWRRFSRCT